MKIKLMICMGLALMLIPACATVDPRDFNALQAQVARDSGRLREVTRRMDALGHNLEGTRAPQADMRAEMASLQRELANLNGQLEETNQRIYGLTNTGADTGDLGAKMNDLEKRLHRLELYLGMGPAGAAAAGGQAPLPAQTTDPYALGLKLYEQKSYTAARDQFEEYLKKSPQASNADDAQFMVGECLYAEKKFDEAILAYNQLVKRYPNSKKAPAGMLKQGMSFDELRDTRTAKTVYNLLIKNYPNSPEAKKAAELVKKIP